MTEKMQCKNAQENCRYKKRLVVMNKMNLSLKKYSQQTFKSQFIKHKAEQMILKVLLKMQSLISLVTKEGSYELKVSDQIKMKD
jgi:hypothetical protein